MKHDPMPEPIAKRPRNRVSLAQWSLHRMLKAGRLAPMDFPEYAKTTFGFTGVEYVSRFYAQMPPESDWARELKSRCDVAGVTSLLIMVDDEGDLGDPDAKGRQGAVESHRRWLDAAAVLGCHSIRVNAKSSGTAEEQRDLCADGIVRLCEFAQASGLAVLIENHGGMSCDGSWVAAVVRKVGMPNCGTLPDFGNFRCEDGTMRDRYEGVAAMMPYARAVSAKSHDFSGDGSETATDFGRMLEIVAAAGYEGWIGVEYEGKILDEVAGIVATRDLLLKHGCRL